MQRARSQTPAAGLGGSQEESELLERMAACAPSVGVETLRAKMREHVGHDATLANLQHDLDTRHRILMDNLRAQHRLTKDRETDHHCQVRMIRGV
jgi:hypothetical protein